MHEHSIANKIISDAKAYGKVKSITIEVGDLAHLPAEDMQKVLSEKQPNWEILIEKIPARVKCQCGYEGEPEILQQLHDHNIYQCPKCRHPLPEILEGEDILIKEVEVEE